MRNLLEEILINTDFTQLSDLRLRQNINEVISALLHIMQGKKEFSYRQWEKAFQYLLQSAYTGKESVEVGLLRELFVRKQMEESQNHKYDGFAV